MSFSNTWQAVPLRIAVTKVYIPATFRKAQLFLFIIWSVDLSEIQMAVWQ